MAVDLWPYSGRNDGAVSDAEHEDLWGPDVDGVLPGQATTALQPAVSVGTWSVQPGKALVGGRVFVVDSAASGSVTTNSETVARIDCIVLRVDKTSTTWSYAVAVREGVPGGGQPPHSRDRLGVYEFLLGTMTVAPGGGASLTKDARVWHAGSIMTCTSGSRPFGVVAGGLAYENDTDRMIRFNGTQWVALSSDSGWVNVAPYTPYYKVVDATPPAVRAVYGFGYLAGAVSRGNGNLAAYDAESLILTLPDGYRPSREYQQGVHVGNNPVYSGRIRVQADGGVYLVRLNGRLDVGGYVYLSQASGWPIG